MQKSVGALVGDCVGAFVGYSVGLSDFVHIPQSETKKGISCLENSVWKYKKLK